MLRLRLLFAARARWHTWLLHNLRESPENAAEKCAFGPDVTPSPCGESDHVHALLTHAERGSQAIHTLYDLDGS